MTGTHFTSALISGHLRPNLLRAQRLPHQAATSTRTPKSCLQNNVSGLVNVLDAMVADPRRATSGAALEAHLIPLAVDAASRRGPPLQIFVADYPTTDGTCERDFIHVSDLAAAHVTALRHITNGAGTLTLNLGMVGLAPFSASYQPSSG
jgi:nucleoside-diphosphate-sugar epimerase